MGNLLSRTRLVLGGAYLLNKFIGVLSKRIKQSPGIPVQDPTLSFWTVPKAKLSSEGKALPAHADIVVIGSGITGTSFAYNALKLDGTLKIVILEARDTCSGATGRNGGHVNPPLYHDYAELKEEYGVDVAKKNIRFRLQHFKEFRDIAESEGLLEHSQCRAIDNQDVFFDEEQYAAVKAALETWKSEMPEEAKTWEAVDGPEASKKFGLAKGVAGTIHGSGGAMHPYRFVTGVLAKLLDRYDNFFVATHTPCESIQAPSAAQPYYTLTTPNGQITSSHVVHATNAWTSHLLPPLREKIIPLRGTMSAQRPGKSIGPYTLNGYRSYVFNSSGGYDYLTQLPTGEHELMYGGGVAQNIGSGIMDDFACADDSKFSLLTAAHVTGNLPLMFGLETWGPESEPASVDDGQDQDNDVKWAEGRTKAFWSGILAVSADSTPWVGRLPVRLSGRPEPPPTSKPNPSRSSLDYDCEKVAGEAHTSRPGEWIAAGYSGEGMPQAWLSAKALAYMLLDRESEIQRWFPDNFRVTEERWKKADVVDMIIKLAG